MNRSLSKIVTVVFLLTAFAIVSLLLGSCTKTLDGTKFENQKPIVWFANVPPANNLTSTNPIINWVGQDPDGQIVAYRFIVFTVSEMVALDTTGSVTLPINDSIAQLFVDRALATVPDSVWTTLTVDRAKGDGNPNTSVIIPLKAEITDPVNIRVRQYVFVQAFDDEDLASDIVFRIFRRIDNPPDTRTLAFTGGPFINAVPDPSLSRADGINALSSIVGVPMRWKGSDVIDFPTDPPPFEYEYRLYGPYYSQKLESDTLPDDTWENMTSQFVKTVFVTNDARLFELGLGLKDTIIDTTGFDTLGNAIEDTTVILVDTVGSANRFGSLDTIFDVNDPAFVNDTVLYNVVALQSKDTIDGDEWVTDLRTRMFDAFWAEPSDTTQEQWFVFWVRSRDDAKVPDLTPAFEVFTIIDPKYERDIGIVDISISFEINGRILDTAKAYWSNAVNTWAATLPTTINFDIAKDYTLASQAAGFIFPLRRMLSHKMIIMVNDNPYPGAMGNPSFAADIFTSIDAGVNYWLCGRAQLFGGEATAENFDAFAALPSSLTGVRSTNPIFIPIQPFTGVFFYFGLENKVYSGWELRRLLQNQRIEDFVGAFSMDQTRWPELAIDTANLHNRYKWRDHYPWRPDIAALPEVNWFVRSVGSEAMYLYKSKFGTQHWLNDPNFDFQGRPVMHRLNRGLFRTAYSQFTPYAFVDSDMQITINSVLDFLYDPWLQSPPVSSRFSGAKVPTSNREVGERYWQRMKESYEQRRSQGKIYSR